MKGELKMGISEARKQANLKWDRENTEKITIKLNKNTDPSKEQIRRTAEQNGMSVNQWIIHTIRKHL